MATAVANSNSSDPNDTDPDVWSVPDGSGTITPQIAPSSTRVPSPTTITGKKPKPTKCHCVEGSCTAEPPGADVGCCANGTCGFHPGTG
jgi:hypothetical protein